MPRSGYTICTSEQRLASTPVSQGFAIEWYSSPPFGSHGPCNHSELCPLDIKTGVPCSNHTATCGSQRFGEGTSGSPWQGPFGGRDRETQSQQPLHRQPTCRGHWQGGFIPDGTSTFPLVASLLLSVGAPAVAPIWEALPSPRSVVLLITPSDKQAP